MHKFHLKTEHYVAVRQLLKYCIMCVCAACSTGYPCDNGECIDLANRCNSNSNCTDNSDEINCSSEFII